MNTLPYTSKQTVVFSRIIAAANLFYIFGHPFDLPFEPVVFLYFAAFALIVMAVLKRKVIMTFHTVTGAVLLLASMIGLLYTPMLQDGIREFIFFVLYFATMLFANNEPYLIRLITRGVYFISVVVMFTVLLQALIPEFFLLFAQRILRADMYRYLLRSYLVDSAYAGIAAHTLNAAFFTAFVFGHSYLNLVRKDDDPLIRSKWINIFLLVVSLYVIILSSKRGIFLAVGAAFLFLVCYLNRRRDFLVKLAAVLLGIFVFLFALYFLNDNAAAFIDRFIKNDNLFTGRIEIYTELWESFLQGNILIGRGTGAAYALAGSGAHNIYLQILYEHGLLLSIPYLAFLLYNFYTAFQKKCPMAIYVNTMFLVYGVSGNPLYSQMFMILYIFYLLYALRWETFHEDWNIDLSQCD